MLALLRLCLFTPRGCPAYRDSLLDSGFLCYAVAGAAPLPAMFVHASRLSGVSRLPDSGFLCYVVAGAAPLPAVAVLLLSGRAGGGRCLGVASDVGAVVSTIYSRVRMPVCLCVCVCARALLE